MPGANGARATVCGALPMPFDCTMSCVDVLGASAAGTSTFNCVSLLNRIWPGMPSNDTLRLGPEKRAPMSVAIDPGASAPLLNVAAFNTLVTVGAGIAGGGAVEIVKVIATSREPARGPASIVRMAL